MPKSKNRRLICPGCENWHEVDSKTLAGFGPDALCMKCVNKKHIEFMARNAKAFGLIPCVKNCPCGFGGENQ